MNQLADFIRSRLFTSIAGAAVIAVALLLLLHSFFGTFIETPATTIEHELHLVAADVTEAPTRRAGIRANTILLEMDGLQIYGATDDELNDHFINAQRAAYEAAGPDDDFYGVPFTIYVAGDTETITYDQRFDRERLPASEVEFATWASLGIETAAVAARDIPNPDKTSISMMDVWLGGTDDVPTLNIDSIREGRSGFNAVRGIDRILVLYPLGLVAIIIMTGLWMQIRWNGEPHEYRRGLITEPIKVGRFTFTEGRLIGYVVTVALLVMLVVPVWQFFSDLNLRADLIDDYKEQVDPSVLPEDFVSVFHIRETTITADVTRLDAPSGADITRATLVELRRSYAVDNAVNLALLMLGVAFAVMTITFFESDGILSNTERLWAVLVLVPSIGLLAIFVYGFIAQTIVFSVSDWGEINKGAPPGVSDNLTRVNIGLENYEDLMTDLTEFPFRNSLVNTIFFTILFLGGALLMGFVLALLVDQRVRGEGIFRTIFLFPMSLSLVVTGTVWNWLLQPQGGINKLPEFLGMEPLEYRWLNSRNLIYEFTWPEASMFVYLGLALFGVTLFNYMARASERTHLYTSLVAVALVWGAYVAGFWEGIWPPLDNPIAEPARGYNVALSGVVIAAVWQMSGYVMALFLAGIRGVPEEIREAARVDGCAEYQVYMFVILPSLRPIVLSAVIILGHISLKIFDLVFAMAGTDNQQTNVPGIVLYTKAFRGGRFASGSAVAVVMLVLVSLVIIPYLWSNTRQEQGS